eukprot:UN23688
MYKTGACSYGKRCTYLHDEKRLQIDNIYRLYFSKEHNSIHVCVSMGYEFRVYTLPVIYRGYNPEIYRIVHIIKHYCENRLNINKEKPVDIEKPTTKSLIRHNMNNMTKNNNSMNDICNINRKINNMTSRYVNSHGYQHSNMYMQRYANNVFYQQCIHPITGQPCFIPVQRYVQYQYAQPIHSHSYNSTITPPKSPATRSVKSDVSNTKKSDISNTAPSLHDCNTSISSDSIPVFDSVVFVPNVNPKSSSPSQSIDTLSNSSDIMPLKIAEPAKKPIM